MSFELREIGKSKLYTSIVDQILEGVRSSAFPPGTALPAERILAQRLGVSRGSVREAIRVLEHAGVLDVRSGSGTFVTSAALSQAAALRAHAALVGEESPLDIMVARRAIEPTAARLAAEHRDGQDVEALKTTIDEQARLVEAGNDPTAADLRFHRMLAHAGQNPVLAMLIDRIIDILGQNTWLALKNQTLINPGRPREYLEQHTQIANHVIAQNPTAAEAAMLRHLDSVESGLLAQLDRHEPEAPVAGETMLIGRRLS